MHDPNTHNMAHTILVRLDVDDEYADIHPEITATDYLEGSKAHGWEVVTERVFTESEVRAIIARLPVQAMVGTPCVMLEDIAPAFGLSDPA